VNTQALTFPNYSERVQCCARDGRTPNFDLLQPWVQKTGSKAAHLHLADHAFAQVENHARFRGPAHFVDCALHAFCVRCLKRLVNGREDNVWNKYVHFVVGKTNDMPITPTYYSNREEWLKVEGAMTNFIK
jgi:hypothetical protein